MRSRTISINWVAFVTCGLSIWLGVTGRVSWWVVALIWLAGTKLKQTFRWGGVR